ncbi:hypothetical protein EDC01DRAFT_683440 [Geopyxis carbonaria]|nr:hypothetical protein EDC01DRAFT_683440 [Geopyxis carbonaria]
MKRPLLRLLRAPHPATPQRRWYPQKYYPPYNRDSLDIPLPIPESERRAPPRLPRRKRERDRAPKPSGFSLQAPPKRAAPVPDPATKESESPPNIYPLLMTAAQGGPLDVAKLRSVRLTNTPQPLRFFQLPLSTAIRAPIPAAAEQILYEAVLSAACEKGIGRKAMVRVDRDTKEPVELYPALDVPAPGWIVGDVVDVDHGLQKAVRRADRAAARRAEGNRGKGGVLPEVGESGAEDGQAAVMVLSARDVAQPPVIVHRLAGGERRYYPLLLGLRWRPDEERVFWRVWADELKRAPGEVMAVKVEVGVAQRHRKGRWTLPLRVVSKLLARWVQEAQKGGKEWRLDSEKVADEVREKKKAEEEARERKKWKKVVWEDVEPDAQGKKMRKVEWVKVEE